MNKSKFKDVILKQKNNQHFWVHMDNLVWKKPVKELLRDFVEVEVK